MEGLHHDTTLEKQTPVSLGESNDESIVDAKSEENQTSDSTQDYSQKEINLNLSNEQKIDLLSQMIRIRRFEERSLRAYQQGHIAVSYTHLTLPTILLV